MKIVDRISGSATAIVRPLIVIALIVAAYLIVRGIWRAYKNRRIGKTPYNEKNTNPSVNYDNYAKAVENDFSGWFPDADKMNKTAGNLMALNDDELKKVYNRYDSLFGKGAKTMYDKIDGPICWPCVNRSALLKRMERLNLL